MFTESLWMIWVWIVGVVSCLYGIAVVEAILDGGVDDRPSRSSDGGGP